MDRINFGYSVKNIPISNERSYKLQLIDKIEAVIKRMRWKAAFHNGPNERTSKDDKIETYGLKSAYCPRQIPELHPFESDLIKLAENIKFRKSTSNFQKRMKEDVRNIQKSSKTLTPADKTSNMYRLTKEHYNKLKHNAITSTYKKASVKIKEKVDKSGIKLAKDAGILDRIQVNGTNNCFITSKDQEENFENSTTTRLINPAKNEVGRISKIILDKINLNLKEQLGVNQWKNTASVINWFKEIPSKSVHTLTMFDIKDFCPF